jgi:hypothetical protein
VLAAQVDDEAVRLRSVSVDHLGEVIVGLLPDAGRGTESSISLPVTVEQGGQTLARLTTSPRERAARSPPTPSAASGTAAARRWLSWFDNGTGRYFARQGTPMGHSRPVRPPRHACPGR